MPGTDRSAGVVRFDGFELHVRSGELFKDGGRVLRLSEQPLRVLIALLEGPGDLVLRDDLRKRLWPSDTVVEFEHGIGSAVNRLRQALDDSAENPRFIETLARRGYRWKTPVEWVASESAVVPEHLATPATRASQEVVMPATPRRDWMTVAVAIAIFVLVVGMVFGLFARRTTLQTARDFRQRQLTVNSFENPVSGGAISPDGKYLAYNDLDGIHLKLIETGEIQSIRIPEIFRGSSPFWEVGYWLPDSTHFFAIAEFPEQSSSLWNISVTGSAQRIAENSNPWGVSPDGSRLAVTRRNDQEIWLMDRNGEHPRKICEGEERTSFRAVQWSSDGQRIAYISSRLIDGKNQSAIESRDVNGGPAVEMLSGATTQQVSQLIEGLRDLNWLPDGRLIYVGGDPDIHGLSCNLWEARVDLQTGKIISPPERLTNWAGFCVSDLTLTTNGKKLAFDRSSDLWTVFAGDFDSARTQLSQPKKLTFTEDLSSPSGWSSDSSAVFIRSNREGTWGIYKQSLDGSAAQPIVTRLPDVSRSTPISPDGKWLIYSSRDMSGPSENIRVMRVPLSGGPPQEIVVGRYRDIACALGGGACVVAETTPDGKQIVFSALDPMNGKGRELAQFGGEFTDEFGWDLSPDGTQLVLFRNLDSHFRILKLASGQPVREVRTDNDTHLRNLHWAADGKGVFASAPTQHGARLVYVDLHGKLHQLWEVKGFNPFLAGRPSPDGRHLAIQGTTGTANMWMIENF